MRLPSGISVKNTYNILSFNFLYDSLGLAIAFTYLKGKVAK
jgi:hypothetical protein